MKDLICNLLVGLAKVLLGLALFVSTVLIGGAVVFRIMKYFHFGCAGPWTGAAPHEMACDNMGYVIPVLSIGLLSGLFAITSYVVILRRIRSRPSRKATLDLLAGMLVTLLGMVLFAAAFFLGGVATVHITEYFDIGCVGPWAGAAPIDVSCTQDDYIRPIALGGLAAGLITVITYALALRRLRDNGGHEKES
ncbi:hypothetical protein ACQEU5_19225 [Marinactinospora thermotolerans]|uniref:Uncharacterized protein n=1 Tax=Marinactinospora thermotolerans DSM 45154 TaxID=1122192 RepID=A0A1T4NJX3_9ACTN|nr:hypothetical protein [Marinactinospora thermotolerans]SJZ79048.1 hypothetical protein SAMN02745673_01464 [Marinactinospora thermotolerans DSM 45154]